VASDENKKDDYLLSAEMAVEGNYNMVGDGIINNVPPRSLKERLQEANKRKKERHKEHKVTRKRERHKEQRHERERS